MKSLYLVRHAKSSWEHGDVADYDRPLKERGVRDAHLVSKYLFNEVAVPEAIYSSPAIRATHTAVIFARNMNFPFSSIELQEKLYMCSTNRLLEFIRSLDDQFDRVMVFGHNPTITSFVNQCADRYIENVPTSGATCINFEVNSWKKASFLGRLTLFDTPKNHKRK